MILSVNSSCYIDVDYLRSGIYIFINYNIKIKFLALKINFVTIDLDSISLYFFMTERSFLFLNMLNFFCRHSYKLTIIFIAYTLI